MNPDYVPSPAKLHYEAENLRKQEERAKGYKCRFCSKTCSNSGALKIHEKHCRSNPQFIPKHPVQTQPKINTGKGATPEIEAARRAKISAYAKARKFGGLTHGSGRGKKGWYKGFFCDSTYELVYVIYNIDNNISFKRCNRAYEYTLDGVVHKYYPDFELSDGTIVETKGYHTELVDMKTSSVTDRPILVLYEKDLQYAFDWVKSNYKYKSIEDLYESKMEG